ncbi:hypothetical protein BH10PSE14_BH10PSE14_31690 [soil metagenome]
MFFRRTAGGLPCMIFAAAMLCAPVVAISAVPAAAIVDARRDDDQPAALDLARERRVARVGYRLASAAAALCDQPEPMTGMVLHDIASYAAADRAAVSRAYQLGRGFGVRLVVPDSAAARAGIRDGDEIVSLNGVDMETFAPALIGRDGSPARIERFAAIMRDSLATGPASLTLRRGGATVSVVLAADRGCSARFVVNTGNERNAWSDGTGVAVTGKLVDFLRNDDELAYILAHEMAHNILHHAQLTKGRSSTLASLGIGAGLIKATEIAADRLAVRLMLIAHYDPRGGETFLQRFSKTEVLELAFTHQGTARRIQTLREARAALAGPPPMAPVVPAAALPDR